MGIGFKIRKLAEQEKLAITELARRLGRTKQATYEMLEKDDISTALLREVMKIFNVQSSYFFDEDPVSNKAIASGNNSVAAINSEVKSKEDAGLEEKIRLLEQLLKEKERTIQILMQK